MITMIVISVLPWQAEQLGPTGQSAKNRPSAVGSAKKHWDALR
jgi:hypothetical protein